MTKQNIIEGRYAAQCFEKYWRGFIMTNPECDNMEWKVAIGMVYLNGFSKGLDYKQTLIEEMIQNN